jgi:hypothetical protein
MSFSLYAFDFQKQLININFSTKIIVKFNVKIKMNKKMQFC